MKSALKLVCTVALAVGLGANATQMRKPTPKRAPAKINTKINNKINSKAPKAKSKIASRFALPTLISYQQLKALTPKKRAAYLGRVRFALVQMEKMQAGMIRGTQKTAMIEGLREFIAQFSFMDFAHADPPTGKPALTRGADGTYSFACAQSPQMPGRPLVVDPFTNTCVLAIAGGRAYDADAHNGDCSSFPGTTYIRYRVDNQNFRDERVGRCATNSSLALLRPDLQSDLNPPWYRVLRSYDEDRAVSSFPTSAEAMTYARRTIDVSNIASVASPSAVVPVTTAPASTAPDASVVGSGLAPLTSVRPPERPAGMTNADELIRARNSDKVVLPVAEDGIWTCKDSTYEFDTYYGTCARTGACDANEGVDVDGTNCIPNSSYLALSADQRKKVCPAEAGAVTTGSGTVTCNSQMGTEEASLWVTDQTEQAVLGGALSAAELAQRSYIRGLAGMSAGRLEAAVRRQRENETPAARAQREGDLLLEREAARVKAEEEAAAEAAAEAVAPSATGGTCEWAPLVGECAEKPYDDRTTRRAFHEAHRNHFAAADQALKVNCIVSGNFSTFEGNKASSNSCDRVRSVPGTSLTCTRSSEILCNPLVFGVTAEGGAVCVRGNGVGGAATAASTAACVAKVPPAEFHEATAATGASGEEWDKFKANFEESYKGYCVASQSTSAFAPVFANYFCNECAAIGRAIVAANQTYARDLGICNGAGAAAAPADPATADPATSN